MKKLYTLAFATLLALTASAQGRQKAVERVPQRSKATEMRTSLSSLSLLSPKAGISDIAGDYEWSYYGLLTNDQGYKSAVVKIAVTDAATGEISISDMVSAGTGIKTPVKATVNLSNGTVTLPNKQSLGADSYGDPNYFYIKTLTADGDLVDGAYDGESITGTISGQTITFSDDYVFAIGDFNDENLGWWKLTADNSFTVYVEPDNGIDLSEWTEFSTATVIDGWVLPVMKYNSGEYVNINDFPLTVKIARNKENPNLLLLVDPYVSTVSGFPVSGGQSGYIVLDVTDPEFVLVNPGVFSGYSNGSNKVCCTNVEGFFVAQGYTKSVIQSALGEDFPVWSTLTKDADGNTVIDLPNCRFQYTSDASEMYAWTDRADAMKAKITFKDVAGDDGTIGGIKYTLNEDGTAEVIGCADTLTDLNIPAEITSAEKTYSVTSIAEAAFQANTKITSVSIPASVKTVARDAFRNLSGLKTLYAADLAAWCGIQFENGLANPIYNLCNGNNEANWGKFYVQNVNGEANQVDFNNLVIPEGVTSMSTSFYGYKALTSVTLPSTLTYLGNQTFANCAKLTEVTVPEGVTAIGSAFFACEGLKSVKLPSTLETLEGNTFYNNKALEEIELPASLKSIGIMTFCGCTGLTKITSYAETPAEAKLFAFDDVNVEIPVYVPAPSIEAYKAAAEWSNFTNYQEIPGSAVNEIAVDGNATAEYFNLQGVKVANPENGVFIRVQGGKTSKVLVK